MARVTAGSVPRAGHPMRVLSVAFPEVPVGTALSGGAEQILATLERGLVETGHQSLVVAARGSKVSGGLIEAGEIGTAPEEYRHAIEKAVKEFSPDLIHFHGLDFHRYIPRSDARMLATLHLPVPYYPAQVLKGQIRLNCVSRSQALSSEATRHLPVIPNGVRITEAGGRERGHYLLWLGRICHEKGAHIAIEVARRVDARLIVAGPVLAYEAHRRYFAERVAPLLDDKRTYAGAVFGIEKEQLVRGASCVLIPSLVAETSSLVAMESLMCGVPVVAFGAGALPEIVDNGRTGFIVDSAEEMAEALGRVGELSGSFCREQAIQRFGADRMIRDYLTLYGAMNTRYFAMG